MKGANLSPKTIQTYTALVKSIVASVIDEETGEPVFNRKWNASVLDLPIVENQKQPCFTKMEIQKMLRNSCGWERVLYLILASTGLRIGEALGLESKHVVHVVNGGTTLRVEQQVNRFGEIVPYTKTRAGMREVDLCSEVSGLIRLQAKMANGLLFATRNGTPHLSGNVEKRRLRGHTEKGFHAFRRFRNTHLREMNALPDLIVFWMGHSAKGSMTEVYSKLSTNLKARQAEAERVGLGFKIVQTYREIQAEELELAAD
jgi:integrase